MPLPDAIARRPDRHRRRRAGADEAGRRHPVRLRRDGGAAAAARRRSCFPARTDDVSRCVQLAASESVADRDARVGHGAERRQRAERRRDGAVPRADERDPRRRSAQPRRCARSRASRRITIDEAAARHGLFYPPDPGSMRISTHRRQRRGELRRAARAEVRRHARLRDGARGRAGRRPDRAVRQPVRQGRRRLLDEGPLHRLGRHARHHHRGAAEAGAAAGGAADDAGALRSDRGCGGDRLGDHRGADHPVHARVPRSDDGAAASRTTPTSACRPTATRCC